MTCGYTEYVTAALPELRRTAYLICGDVRLTDATVQTALTKLYRRWDKAPADLDTYARTLVVRTLLHERRAMTSRTRRAVFVLRYVLDLPVEDVARTLSISQRAVNVVTSISGPSEDELEALRVAEVPAGDVSVERAIQKGKRFNALRVAAEVMVVVVIAGIVWQAAPPDESRVRRAAFPMTAFDPFVRTVTAKPTRQLTPAEYTLTRTRTTIFYEPLENSNYRGKVTIWATGQAVVPSGEAMPDVRGRRALWTGDALAWEWAAGSWAFAEAVTSGEREEAHLLAENIEHGEHHRLTFPFTVQPTRPFVAVHTFHRGGVWLEFAGDVILSWGNGAPVVSERSLTKTVPRTELQALENAVRPADPPVSNPLR